MNFEMVVTAVLVGAIAGWVAGRVMRPSVINSK